MNKLKRLDNLVFQGVWCHFPVPLTCTLERQGFTLSVYAPMQLPVKALRELVERVKYPGLRLDHLRFKKF